MTTQELIQTILFVMATAIMPVVVKYVVAYLQTKSDILIDSFENETLREYADDAIECVLNAVIAVNQTFVESLKNSGSFTESSQREAFNKAKQLVLSLISDNSKKAIEKLYGDFNTWLENQIEVCVNEAKA